MMPFIERKWDGTFVCPSCFNQDAEEAYVSEDRSVVGCEQCTTSCRCCFDIIWHGNARCLCDECRDHEDQCKKFYRKDLTELLVDFCKKL